MAIDALQKIFKTLADPTRVRILALLEREELAVQDLMEVLGMAQSRVSRHLGILREAGLLEDRRDGTFVFYRFMPPQDGEWHEAWQLVRESLRSDPNALGDQAALERRLDARKSRTRDFFDAVGPEWDALRKVFNDDHLRARALTRLVPAGLKVADVGTGTGILAFEMARLGLDVVAIDHSRRMLDAARAKLADDPLDNLEFREGDAGALPLQDGEVDATFAHMVLHYLPSPAEAIAEMARAIRPGGSVVLVDFERHEQEWMRDELGVLWLGFDSGELREWFSRAGLEDVRIELDASLPRARELPVTFIASARKPKRS